MIMEKKNFIKRLLGRKHGIYILPALILLIALFFMIFKMIFQPPQMQMPPAMVTLTTVREEPIELSETFIGLVEAKEEVEIKPRVKGFLLERPFVEGEIVDEGQVLFLIEPTQYQAALKAAKAMELSAQAILDRAEADFKRIEGLFKKSSTTKAEYDANKAIYDSAKADFLQAQAQVQQAELNLNYTKIKAPFRGQISDSEFHNGSLLEPDAGQILTTLVSIDPILVTFGVSEQAVKAYRKKKINLQLEKALVRVMLDEEQNLTREGRLIFVDSKVNKQTDTVKFKAVIDNADHVLLPGQIVTLQLIGQSGRPGILVPQKTVMTAHDGQRYVMIVDQEGKSAMKPVVVEADHGADYFISSGLSAGQEIIKDGLVYMGSPLPPGMPVQVMGGAEANQGAQNQPGQAEASQTDKGSR